MRLIDNLVIEPLLDRYERLEAEFATLQGAYAAAELDYRLYPEADEKRADLNESAAELLGDLVVALRQEMAVGPEAAR